MGNALLPGVQRRNKAMRSAMQQNNFPQRNLI